MLWVYQIIISYGGPVFKVVTRFSENSLYPEALFLRQTFVPYNTSKVRYDLPRIFL
ncbi:hypothetical protein RM553_13320 [Zunongwangia sp. F363]|uniref:Uncharacterized protein n=1 Tax=Autumnicola tepida TaxID=3075595 RepID=A0ABU3CBV8_9FLAO|nr:hypothetical protein [Zunongwangia sp. F363]MDT0643815.1 hypothetical protein [Zunongwangia sp. F363]